jgi:hypothetical protein
MPLLEDERSVRASSSADVNAMNINERWSVSLNITKTDGRTHAATPSP